MNQENIKTIYSNLIKDLDNLFNVFKKKEKEIVFLLEDSDIDSKSYFKSYMELISRHDSRYSKFVKFQNIKKKANYLLYEILENYQNYIKTYDHFSNFVQEKNIEKYKTNTIRKLLLKTNYFNEEILKTLVLDHNLEFNDYLENLNNLEDILVDLKSNLSVIEHLIFTQDTYNYNLDYSRIKKIKLDNLESGDLIFFDEDIKNTNSLVTKQLSKMTKTNILHLALFYKKENSKYYVFQARGANRKKTYIAPISVKKGYKYIVLRLSDKLTQQEKKIIRKKIIENINVKFSLIKIYSAAVNRFLIRIYKNWFPFLDMGTNPWKSSKVFCSEIIATIFREMGHNIANKPDSAQASPIDLFNSAALEVVGYIEEK